MIDENELDEALRTLDLRASEVPAVRGAVEELTIAFTDLGARVRTAREMRRRRWKLGLGAAAVVVLIGVPAGAVAVSSLTAHTGKFGGEGTEIVDDSEWIAISADDAPQAIAEAYPAGIPLPPGAVEADVAGPVSDMLAGLGADGSQSLMQETAIQVVFENGARCLWYRYWLYADENGDRDGRDAATVAIQDSVSWPATVATDGGGVVDYLQEQADTAAAGDRKMMVRYYGRSCDAFGRIFQ